jgi:DNA invertase Pin-like site-specific DNA recombinase
MTAPVTAAYYRQSVDDPDGIERQRAIVRPLCSSRGWTDLREYEDNDESATPERRKGTSRPELARLWADVEAGEVARIVVSVADRLYRHPRELEDIIDFTADHKVPLVVAGGELDLATDTGRLVARVLGATARAEIERKNARHRDALKQAAEKGKPHWPRRPFGLTVPVPPPEGERWSAKGQPIILEPAEAALIRQAYADVLAGTSLHQIASDWNERGITPPGGTIWRGAQVRQLLLSARNAGLRTYQGEVVGQGDWPAIVPVDVFDGVVAILNDPGRVSGKSRARVYLLTGLATCGKCGQPVGSAPRPKVGAAYVCKTPKCHGVARLAANVDRLITGLVVARLSEPDAVELLVSRDAADVDDLRQRAAALNAKIEESRQLYEDGTLTAAELRTTRANLSAKLDAINTQLHDTSRVEVFQGLPLGTPEVADAFDALPLDRQRTVIAALVSIVINPGGKGARFDPDSIDTTWKV